MIKKGIQINNWKLVSNILYADDQILMATSEDDLQTMEYHLNLTARKYKMTISSTKTKAMEIPWMWDVSQLQVEGLRGLIGYTHPLT